MKRKAFLLAIGINVLFFVYVPSGLMAQADDREAEVQIEEQEPSVDFGHLLKVLGNHDDSMIVARKATVEILGRLAFSRLADARKPEITAALVEALRTDPAPEVRLETVKILDWELKENSLPDPGILIALSRSLWEDKEPDPEVRAAAAYVLEGFKCRDASRQKEAKGLGMASVYSCQDYDIIMALAHAMEMDSNPRVRSYATTSLGTIMSIGEYQDPGALDAFVRVAFSNPKESEIQNQAAMKLSYSGDCRPVVVSALSHILISPGSYWARSASAHGLGNCRADDSGAVYALSQAVEYDEDIDIRRAAAASLLLIGKVETANILKHAAEMDSRLEEYRFYADNLLEELEKKSGSSDSAIPVQVP